MDLRNKYLGEIMWKQQKRPLNFIFFVFFIDSLGGGGAERVVSTLSSRFAQTDRYHVQIVMLRKVPIAYQPDARVQLLYAEDLPVRSFYGKFHFFSSLTYHVIVYNLLFARGRRRKARRGHGRI